MPRQPVDALVLAGGAFDDAAAPAFGVRARALAPFRGKPFIEWVVDAMHDCPLVGRITVVGPDIARQGPWAAHVHRWIPEREGIVENLLAGMGMRAGTLVPEGESVVDDEALDPGDEGGEGGEADLLITASDNPLLTAAAFEDLVERAPVGSGVSYPYLPHSAFLERFPGAENIPLRLADGMWIGGCCILVRHPALLPAMLLAQKVLNARKSKWRMVRLLGPGFVVKFALHRATVADVTARASAILGAPVRFVPDCAPEFAIDVDEPADLEYLERWAHAHLTSCG